jgi:uncharacterized protein with LGFP repeats
VTPVRRLAVALLTTAAAAAVAVAGIAGVPTRAEATTAATSSTASILSSFNPADIISDSVMYNPSTMSVSQIQSFLNAEQPTCASGYTCLRTYRANTQTMAANLMCGTYTGASNETAATIIYKVAHACRINPQVILVTLQKEQGLITGVNLSWYPNAYRSATGLGCPDTAPCDSSKYGFFNQVYGLGYWLIRYTTPPGTTGPGWTSFSWFPVGKNSAILYNPDASCGSKLVTIANKATASLYYYTPYVPNAAALAAGYGTGDSCSAYGNRNFYLYFTQWFGSTHMSVTGAIRTYWTTHGGASGMLGQPTASASTSTSNGGGTSQTFQHGTVYSSKSGTFAIRGALLTEYNRRGGVGGSLQWPIADQTTVTANGGGTMQRFGSGELYSSAAGTYAVRGDLRTAYLALGGANGSMGFPKDTAVTLGTGWVQHFTKGTTYFNSSTGGFGVPSAIDAGYTTRNGPTGSLGWPVAKAAGRTADGITGTVQGFQQGDLYASSAGTAVVPATSHAAFSASSDPFAALGWPRSDAAPTTAAGGGSVQVFTSGRLYAPSGKPAILVTDPVLSSYVKLGDVAGSLGWPVGQQRGSSADGGGWIQAFQGGTLYCSTATRQGVPLTGTLLSFYAAHGEAASSLGWPAAAATTVTAGGASATVQTFSHGATYLQGTTIRTVTGGLYKTYLGLGGPTGQLGWVTGPSVRTSASGGGWTQAFTGATLYYPSRIHRGIPVGGALLELYRARGGAASSLGWPTAAATSLTAAGSSGTVQTFTFGSAYQWGAHVGTVTGGLYTAYQAAGGPAGVLGWVSGGSSHTSANGGGWTQAFSRGELIYSSTTHQGYPLAGPMLALYEHHGGVTGNLGWPGATQALSVNGGGTEVICTGGRMYSSSAGTVAIRGTLLAVYLRQNGPAGRLGWPVRDATYRNGVYTQLFQHGTITSKNGKGTVVLK